MISEPRIPLKDMSVDKQKGRGYIEIRREWCKGCNICVEFCPKHVLCLDERGKVVISDESRCNYCGLCELRCPDFAIEVVKE